MITHTIWFAREIGSATPHRADISSPTNTECLEAARVVWDSLKAQGYYMESGRP